MRTGIKRRLHEILSEPAEGDRLSRAFDVFLMTLILVNVVAVVVGTVEGLSPETVSVLRSLEIYSVIIFTVEYLLRIWTCTLDERFRAPFLGRVRFAFTAMALIDLMAILPFYLPMLIPVDLRFLRALRLFRVFRLVKMGRYSTSLRTLGTVVKNKKEDLLMVAFAGVILLVIASSLVFFAEREAQPEAFSSIPAAMWWGVATLTSVGRGAVAPVTAFGNIIGVVISLLLRIGLFALPAGILASGFVEQAQKRRTKGAVCPHCGKELA